MVRARGLTVLITATLVAFACGSTTTGGSSSKGEIDIASDLPVSGADASSGLPTQQGAQFALQHIVGSGTYHGFTFKFVAKDDAVNGAHDAQKGVQNVQSMLADSKILGMVGPFNSGVAKAEIPVANQAPLAMISPSNTNECLTQSLPYCQAANGFTPASLRPSGKNNYFRVAAADTFQGPAMADFAQKPSPGLNISKVAVWDDEETFGKGVADNFAKEFTAKGGTVVDRKSYDPKSKADFHDFITSAISKGAQGIYVGATSATKGCIARGEMTAAQASSLFYLGPDGIGDGQCVKDSGANANEKMYATQGVADATQNPAAAGTVSAYKQQYPQSSDIGAYTFAGYDCAAILIDAIGRAIDANGGNMPTRQQVVDQVAKTSNFQGLTGTITFDQNGDPTHPTLQLQHLSGGAWTFVAQFSQ